MSNSEQKDLITSLQFTINPFETMAKMKRTKCPQCNKTFRFYCYQCMKPLPTSSSDEKHANIPNFDLPLKTIILQHKNERKGKSTAIHAKVLCPNSVDIYEYPNIPQELIDNAKNAVLLYPSSDAITVTELILNNNMANSLQKPTEQASTNSLIRYVVFIDSTWQQSKAIFRDKRLANITRCKINSQKTSFWRYQQHGDSFLATIEAIYFFFREYQIEMNKLKFQNEEYSGEYDDLLFFYAFQYDMIQRHYKDHPELKFTAKRGDDYIKYNNESNKRQAINHDLPKQENNLQPNTKQQDESNNNKKIKI
jgi:DTW domain-containing protein YfiP